MTAVRQEGAVEKVINDDWVVFQNLFFYHCRLAREVVCVVFRHLKKNLQKKRTLNLNPRMTTGVWQLEEVGPWIPVDLHFRSKMNPTTSSRTLLVFSFSLSAFSLAESEASR